VQFFLTRIFRRRIVSAISVVLAASFLIIGASFWFRASNVTPIGSPSPSSTPFASYTPFPSSSPSVSPFPSSLPTASASSSPKQTDLPIQIPTPSANITYVSGEKTYPNSGIIYSTNVDVFGGDLEADSFSWGSLYIGETKTLTFNIQSLSNVPIKLALSASDWVPTEISKYLSLSWNSEGLQLMPGQTIQASITLESSSSQSFVNYVFQNNVVLFNFNIHIKSSKS
jgi:hypothetical protein